MADDMGERSEMPTGKRLADARQKGQVAKSQDLSAVVSMCGAMIILIVFGGAVASGLASLLRHTLGAGSGGDSLTVNGIKPYIFTAFGEGVRVLLPVLLVAAVFAFVSNVIQVGWNVSAEPIRPKLTKLNPITGFKRVFGKKGLFKTLFNSVKLAGVLLIAWLVIRGQLQSVAALPGLALMAALSELARLVMILVITLLSILLVLALADYIYQRWQHTQDLKMTKQEVKDERRSMEGDPQIKGKRLQMARQIVMQRIGQAVPEADVILTNPTHFSVAIKYDSKSMRAPRVTAKGVDEVALRIRQIARTHKVPVVERPPLARALYWGVDVGQEIAQEHYEAVAEILAYVYRLDGRSVERPESIETRAPAPAGA